MLNPEQVDLADLALALEDHSPEHTWWFKPETGAVAPRFASGVETLADDTAGLIEVEPLPTAVGYGDMEDFVAQVRDPRARGMLERAINGRGAFRRFKDTLFDYPELRRAWFEFHDIRGEQRAIEWLAERGMISADAAEEALALAHKRRGGDLPGILDAEGVAHRVARDLRRIYRERLRSVLLIGGWARGDAHPESELELVVVLDSIDDRWQEKRRMDQVLWRHSIRYDTVVCGMPATDRELHDGATPLMARASAQALRVV
jgi:Uncharacterised protein family (UPF0158)